jgi:hypothetical protein
MLSALQSELSTGDSSSNYLLRFLASHVSVGGADNSIPAQQMVFLLVVP